MFLGRVGPILIIGLEAGNLSRLKLGQPIVQEVPELPMVAGTRPLTRLLIFFFDDHSNMKERLAQALEAVGIKVAIPEGPAKGPMWG